MTTDIKTIQKTIELLTRKILGGKYKGRLLTTILKQDPGYLGYCLYHHIGITATLGLTEDERIHCLGVHEAQLEERCEQMWEEDYWQWKD